MCDIFINKLSILFMNMFGQRKFLSITFGGDNQIM
jgi:hypothetical protein